MDLTIPPVLTAPIPLPEPVRDPVTVEKLKVYAVSLEKKLDHANDRFSQIRRLETVANGRN